MDDVIVAFGGQEVTSREQLSRAVLGSEIGQTVDVVLWRGKEKMTVSVTLVERSSAD